ncbi:MAG: ROK family protein [Acidimicrobiales bacterium]
MPVIGVDLGGTKILAAVVDGHRVVAKAKCATPTEGPEAVAAAVAELVDGLGGTRRLGLGTPGQVSQPAGVVIGAPNLVGWTEPVPLGDLVRTATGGAKVRVENDVNVATKAELVAGAAVGVSDVLCVFMGTGVGGGLVLDGHLRRGANGLTGEIGHAAFRLDGRLCACGLIGHVEAYAGRAAMEAEARRCHGLGEATALVDLAGDGRMKSNVFARAFAVGDVVATRLLDEAVEAVAAGIAATVMVLDLEMVVIGGGVADKLGADFVARIDDAVRSRLFRIPVGGRPGGAGR